MSAAILFGLVPGMVLAQARPTTQPRPAAPPAQQPRPAARPPAAEPAPPVARTAAESYREGTVELTGSIGGAYRSNGLYFNTVDASSHAGAALIGRLGYNLSANLGISAGAIYAMTGKLNSLLPFGAVTYTFDLNRKLSPFLTAGGGMISVSGSAATGSPASVAAFHGGVGIRSFISDRTALRVEVIGSTQTVTPTPQSGLAFVTIGLSHFLGGGPPPDADGDGVPDKRDACPGTPRGATVDIRGCPRDGDHDGVYDGLDRCPNTPPNTPVDANGCTLDSDHDGVPDSMDRCPNTPAGTAVDANGCPRDSDNDGVPDNLDKCPNTPRGVPVETTGEHAGCPRDSDGDGVPDFSDRCPNTPPNTPVDANGCPRDSDGDGVADNLDRCPNTPPGTAVDPNGCPVQRDSDGDGVPDNADRCPNTPRGTRVDANGCPVAQLPTAVGASLVLRNVTFASGSSRLLPADAAILDPVAAAILATPGSRWEVGGYTDNRGSAAANTRLSAARARAVMQYLIGKGVAASQLTSVGYGPRNPAQPNTTAAGRTANRRVEIKRLQ